MRKFTFDKYVLEVKYPESSGRVRYGAGYTFATRPRGPDQVEYLLHFSAMWFYFLPDGTQDTTKQPSINMALLEQFYIEHRLYEKFIFLHPSLGPQVVRFDQPLEYKILENGNGQVEPFTISLVVQP